MPVEAVAEEIEILMPADQLEATKQRDTEEVAEFITRRVLDRGTTFFDGWSCGRLGRSQLPVPVYPPASIHRVYHEEGKPATVRAIIESNVRLP